MQHTGKKYFTTAMNSFPKDWQILDLDKVGKFSKGKGILKDQLLPAGLPCIRYGEIYTSHEYFVKNFYSFISEETAKESQPIKKNVVLFSGSGETLEDIGKAIAYIGEEAAYAGGDVIILSVNGKADPVYLSYMLNSDFINWQKRRFGQGHSVVHIYPSDLATLKVPVAPLHEQLKIASILRSCDTSIETTQKLIIVKERLKNDLMQQLLTGRKRLKGFNEDWEEKTLGDIGKIRMCKRVFSYETSVEGDIPFYKIGTFGNEADAFISKELYDNYRKRFSFPKKGDILISASGTLGRTVIYDGSPAYFQDSNIVWIENNESIIMNSYLYYVYQIVRYESEGGTIQRLYNNIISNAKFLLPSLPEQRKIASILGACDNEISLLKSQHNALHQQKRGLMQVLLTGEVRVKT